MKLGGSIKGSNSSSSSLSETFSESEEGHVIRDGALADVWEYKSYSTTPRNRNRDDGVDGVAVVDVAAVVNAVAVVPVVAVTGAAVSVVANPKPLNPKP